MTRWLSNQVSPHTLPSDSRWIGQVSRTFVLLGVLSMAVTVNAAPGPSRTDAGLLVATAPNGQMFIVKEDHSTPLVVVNTWFRVGARNEAVEDEGISHFLEHMLFDGTTKRTKEQFDSFIFKHAAQDNAGTRYDQTDYYLLGPAEHFNDFAAVHAEMLMGPALLDEEFTREREVVKEELRRAQDSPGSWLFRQMMTTSFPHLNYDHQVLGSMESLNAQSNQQMRDYFARHYGPNNAYTIVVGDVDADAAMATLLDAFKDWERKDLPPEHPRGKDTQTEPRTIGLGGSFESSSQMLIFKAPEFAQPTTYAMDILMQVLGQGESSRLTKRLRDELGLVSSIEASNYSLIDASAMYVAWELINPAKAEEATNAVLEVLARMRREGPTPEELARAKRQAAVGRVFEQETVLGQARSIGYTTTAVDLETWEVYLDRIFGVTAQDVQWIAQQYLFSDNATLGLIGAEGTLAVHPNWELLDAPFTKLISPTDIGRKGQNPLTQSSAAMVAESVDADGELYTLANGLQVYLKPSHVNPTVGISMGVKGGLVWEDWATSGVANLVMETLPKGTTTRSADDIARVQDELGTFIATDATRDYLILNTLVLASDAQTGLDLLADLAQNPTFPDDEVAKVKEQVLQGLKAEQDDQTTSTLNQLRYAMYGPEHAYGRPYNGRESVVAGLTSADLKAFHAKALHPRNTVLSVVGDFDTEAMKALINAALGDWQAGPSADLLAKPAWDLAEAKPAVGAQRIAVIKDKAQAFIWLGVPGVGLEDPDFPALGVLNTILGSSSQARLFSRLRGKEGLAYGTYSSLLAGQGTGLVLANIGTRPEMYEAAVAGLRREINELKNDGPTEEEVTDAVTYLVGTFAQGHQGHLALANYASANLARELPWNFEYELVDRQEAVTLADVQRVATKYLDLTNHWLAVTGPVYQEPAKLD